MSAKFPRGDGWGKQHLFSLTSIINTSDNDWFVNSWGTFLIYLFIYNKLSVFALSKRDDLKVLILV